MTDTIYTDEDGMMFKYVCSYTHRGATYNVTIWGKSREDAEAALGAIGDNGIVLIKDMGKTATGG
jgi:hypothetical protein